MASKNTEGIIKLRQPIFSRGITTVRQEAVGLQQAGRADKSIWVPPERRATRRAACTQNTLIQPIQLRSLLGRLQTLNSGSRCGVLQIGLYLFVLRIEKAHIDHQISDNWKAGQWPNHQFAGFYRLRQRGDTGETVFAVNIQTIGPTHALAAAPAVGDAAVMLRLNELQHVQHH